MERQPDVVPSARFDRRQSRRGRLANLQLNAALVVVPSDLFRSELDAAEADVAVELDRRRIAEITHSRLNWEAAHQRLPVVSEHRAGGIVEAAGVLKFCGGGRAPTYRFRRIGGGAVEVLRRDSGDCGEGQQQSGGGEVLLHETILSKLIELVDY